MPQIEYRSFLNIDPPQLAEVWRSQPPAPGLVQPMSAALFERHVLSKPYFDRQGLIVATEDKRIVGFAHAGFGPTQDASSISHSTGTTCLVMVRPETDLAVGQELLRRTEGYLRDRCAEIIHGGGCYPLAPFYYGLYGGSEFSGLLDSDPRAQGIFVAAGYVPAKRTLVLERDLAGFRPIVDRQQMQIRRTSSVDTVIDPPAVTWWEACLFEPFERTKCTLVTRDGGPPEASVFIWNMETMIGTRGVHAVGVANLEVIGPRQRQGRAKFLLGEALRQLHSQGFALAQVHVPEENVAAVSLFRNLGFAEVDAAVFYRKA